MRALWSLALAWALVVLTSTLAHALAAQTWVSGVGDDANLCTRPSPCKTFAAALAKTAARGDIFVLDPAGYGVLTITKPISIVADGFTGGVLAAGLGTIGIVINIPSATAADVVVLRGLDINGVGTGQWGIHIVSAGAVHIESSRIYGFTSDGIRADQPTANSRLFVRDTYVHHTFNGLLVGQTVRASVDGFRSEHNQVGIQGTQSAKIHIRNSVLSINAFGVVANDTTRTMVRSTTLGQNADSGVYVSGPGVVVRLGNNTIAGNTIGMRAPNGGQIISFGNNHVHGNVFEGAPTSTIPPM
jgi:hypothetical protein